MNLIPWLRVLARNGGHFLEASALTKIADQMETNPFTQALGRAEKIIAYFYKALNDIQMIVRDPLADDDEKLEQINERIERVRKDIAEIK